MSIGERDSPLRRFGRELRRRPAAALLWLLLEYLQYMGGIGFSLVLLITRVPLRILDRITGLRVRERLIETVARLFPG